MKKVKILLAFDHELPLGSTSTSYQEAIIDPTNEILSLADEIGVKISLFTDILCNDFFKRNNETVFCELYQSQLQKALKSGHDVQLHIHPHWIDSSFHNKNYNPSNSFKLADFKDQAYPNNISGIIEKGIQQLTEICLPAKNDYQCIAYRAGGFNLEPATELIVSALIQQGIHIDSSIPRGLFFKSDYSTVDYKDMPEQCNWFISPNGKLNIPSKEGLLEIPIASIKAGLWTNIIHALRKINNKQRAFSTGKTIHSGKMHLMDKLRFVFSVRMLGFDLYTLSSGDLMKILDSNINRFSENEILLSTVSHPKNMGTYSRLLMKEFVSKARRKYGDTIEFSTFTDVYKTKILNQVR